MVQLVWGRCGAMWGRCGANVGHIYVGQMSGRSGTRRASVSCQLAGDGDYNHHYYVCCPVSFVYAVAVERCAIVGDVKLRLIVRDVLYTDTLRTWSEPCLPFAFKRVATRTFTDLT